MEQWLIKLADDELKLVTSDELLQMEKTAEEFDGFYGWQVLGKLNKHDVGNALIKLLKDIKFSYELTGGIMPQEMERLNKAINDC